MRRSDFRDLQIWHKGKAVCIELYRVTANFPSDEKFGMVAQVRRAALSVTSNIAEGHGRSSNQEFCWFLFMSLGSIRELESLVEISQELGFLEVGSGLTANLQEVARMTTAFITHLKTEECEAKAERIFLR